MRMLTIQVKSSFLEFIQQNGHDLPGDAFSIYAESFEETWQWWLGI